MTHSSIAWTILAITSGMAMIAPARAQEPDTTSTAQALSSVETLNTVTVVGTVDDLQSLDFYAPNSSFVLNRDEIDEQGARKLDQALHYEAGVLSEPDRKSTRLNSSH